MKVAIISGSRADAGALRVVKEGLKRAGVATDWLELQTPSDDSRRSIAATTGGVCERLTQRLYLLKPDLVLLHGDRYEVLGAATSAFLLGLPIAHLGGGDVTQGSQDDSIRHAISKLSHLHFATCESAARRLVQLGEHPTCVYNTGDPGVDILIEDFKPLAKPVVRYLLGINTPNYVMVAFHPNTLGETEPDLKRLVSVLNLELINKPELSVVLLGPNKDAGYELIDAEFRRLNINSRYKYWPHLDRPLYLSALRHAEALMGNSSAGYYEAPALDTEFIEIGNRQKGREKIAYSDGDATKRIVEIILNADLESLLKKKFYNLKSSELTKFGKRYILKADDTQYDLWCIK